MKRSRKNILGGILIASAVVATLTLLLWQRWLSRPDVCAAMVQREVSTTEQNINKLIENNAEYELFAKEGIGLYVFRHDTLLFWNDNSISPKLIRKKIAVGTDTVCNLLTGDCYVKSVEKGGETVYAFKLLNTTYKLENRYFENKWIPAKGPFKVKLALGDIQGQAIVSESGKTLTYCSAEGKPAPNREVRTLFVVLIALLVIAGLLVLVSKPKTDTKSNPRTVVEFGVVTAIVLATVCTFIYYRTDRKHENEEMVALAGKLLEKRDHAFEASFVSFAQQAVADTILREMAFSESNVLADIVLGYSQELLFDTTLKSYIATLTLCAPDEEITIEPEGYDTDCNGYFAEKIANNDNEKVGENLYFMDYPTLDPNYLGIIAIRTADTTQTKSLYFEFYKPIAPEGFSFPQLLQESNRFNRRNDYSVALYKDNILSYKYGRYVFPNFLSGLKATDGQFSSGQRYKHYALKGSGESTIVVSTPLKGWSEITAPFALFFLGLLVLFMLIAWILQPTRRRSGLDKSLRQRLQTVVLSTLAIAVVAVGPVSVVYMRSLYNQKTAQAQFQTTRTLAMEMNKTIAIDASDNNLSKAAWADILQHYSRTFFTDMNLYGLDGTLTATTRQEIYDLNLLAPIMNAEAYHNMNDNKALFYTHEERLGKGLFESAYIPLNDPQGNTLAYLNTPYFSSATELQKEIKSFVLTYINIILVLLGVALVFVLRITKRLTHPLALIQNKLGDIKIDQKNEPIEWKGNDEIGALVKQYNQLIVELEKSAAELKRTTTETAWRGVARQVAHEIKNSLTPMRLSVQMLQRNIENGKATPEQTQRTANTLIEQIDALSDIASSFSRYAKLPENHPQPLDLAELVGNVVNLYDNADNIAFHYVFDKSDDFTYNGDKTNLNSAVSNLVKNATQAIGPKQNGKIEVALKSNEKQFLISVKDNGKGIKDEDKDRIFLPNFTTKSGGSGVGLSLTYNIVQAAGGSISFESKEGNGAEFVIALPKHGNQQESRT